MNQQEINDAEWRNPENWSGRRKTWLAVYFSQKDSRLIVPKSVPVMGWTLNFAKPAAVALVLAVLIGIPLLVVLIVRLTRRG